MISSSPATNHKLQSRLLILAASFLGLYSISISLAPAARNRTWDITYPWTHWVGYLIWLILFLTIHHRTPRILPEGDPYLLPLTGLLSGWGMLTISRLEPTLGLRQSAWLSVSLLLFLIGLRLPADLNFLRKFKYIWLTSGLALTTLTLVFGTNPLGVGPRLWLGCCGIYLQPSEPLKMLLIIYLSAYLADRQINLLAMSKDQKQNALNYLRALFPLLVPTFIMTGIALLLLIVQRDLGTAFVFIFLYAVMVYLASGLQRVLWMSLVMLILAGIAGYLLFDVIKLRVDAWLNPWIDPSGRSYQIVQSLLAAANGGLFGRGPGMGNPGLVPVSHSDFIFVAIQEETGLVGALGLISILIILVQRGIVIALTAPTSFHRLLAAGLTAYLGGQSILIIGGNLRLLPLTGVTLPFVSYGGSSLVTSYLSLLLLLLISNQSGKRPITQFSTLPFRNLGTLLILGSVSTAVVAGWWGIYRGPDLLTRTDNARRTIADRYVKRGAMIDRGDQIVVETVGSSGSLTRKVLYPDLSNIVGYTHPVYGQSGLEASLDAYLRGTQGNPGLQVWWDHLLYGLPPPGLDIRLSLDLELQRQADSLLRNYRAGLVLIDAQSGEILVMASHPTFDANQLDQTWSNLINDPDSPFLNRTTQGLYPVGAALGPFLLALAEERGSLPSFPGKLDFDFSGTTWKCSGIESPIDKVSEWGNAISAGCPGAVASLGKALKTPELLRLYAAARFFSAPELELPTLSKNAPISMPDPQLAALGIFGNVSSPGDILQLSPLQMSLAAAALSYQGLRPSPLMVWGVNTPQAGWVILPSKAETGTIYSANAAQAATEKLNIQGTPFWLSIAVVPKSPSLNNSAYTWGIGGTSANWPGSPLALAVILEEENPALAYEICLKLLNATFKP